MAQRRLARSACHRVKVRGETIRRRWRKWPLGSSRGQREQGRPVRPGRPRSWDVALEDGDLMAQDEDLGAFGMVGAGE